MVKRAVEMEGTVTGEHGVGLIKRDYLNHELGQTTVDAMRKVSEPMMHAFPATAAAAAQHQISSFSRINSLTYCVLYDGTVEAGF